MLQFHLLKFVYQGQKKKGRMEDRNLFSSVYLSSSLVSIIAMWLGNSRVQLGQQIFLYLPFWVVHNFLTNKELPSDDFHYSASKQSTLGPNINAAGDCFSLLSPCLTAVIALSWSACPSLDKVTAS